MGGLGGRANGNGPRLPGESLITGMYCEDEETDRWRRGSTGTTGWELCRLSDGAAIWG